MILSFLNQHLTARKSLYKPLLFFWFVFKYRDCILNIQVRFMVLLKMGIREWKIRELGKWELGNWGIVNSE